MSELAIRSATLADLEAVLELWAIAGLRGGATDNARALRLLLELDPQAMLVADARDTLAGSAIAAFDGWRGSLYRVAVHPEHRRRGVGRRLVREGERRLRKRGVVRAGAIVSAGEEGVEGFWDALGYVQEHEQIRLVASLARPRES